MNIKIKKLEAVLTMWRWEHYFDSGQGNLVRGLFMWDRENALHLCTRFVSCLIWSVNSVGSAINRVWKRKEDQSSAKGWLVHTSTLGYPYDLR